MRNRSGLKDSIDCYRTFDGETFIAWLINPTDDRVKAYRDAGVKCRRVNGEIFIREDDRRVAVDVDYRADAGAKP